MDQFFSNIFPWMGQQQKQARAAAEAAANASLRRDAPSSLSIPVEEMDVIMDTSSVDSPEMNYRKRSRRLSTPTLICSHIAASSRESLAVVSPCHSDTDDDLASLRRPLKMFRGTKHYKIHCIPPPLEEEEEQAISSTKDEREEKVRTQILKETPLDLLPEDIVSHALSFLSGVSDRFSLQCTSKQFRRLSSTPTMMKNIAVGGDPETGMHGIILETDTAATATDKLTPFAAAGNLEAVYMLGIIKSYCDCDVECGVSMLKMASMQGCVRASYALGLVLRDTAPDDAVAYMKLAAEKKYLPALQELLSARDMKLQYGELDAEELRRHMDRLCLNRLLARHYVLASNLRTVHTSHCWNHLCGRWAYKVTNNSTSSVVPGSIMESNLTPTRIAHSSSSTQGTPNNDALHRVSRMKMCSRCCRAKYCSKLCQVYDWRSGRHKLECQFL